MTLSLDTLTLDQIPGLTDEDHDRLWAELDGRPVSWIVYEDGTRAICGVQLEADPHIHTSIRICHPDCPASILEALPVLVELWTGRSVQFWIAWPSSSPVGISVHPPRLPENIVMYSALRDNGQDRSYRHLPHACFSAAWAACVVLGRMG